MAVQRAVCNACGANLTVPEGAQETRCEFCGSRWRIEHSAGQATLIAADKLGQAVQDAGTATQAGLLRLQQIQELSGLRLQLQQVQAEMRTLQRERLDKRGKGQLRDLGAQESELLAQIDELEEQITPTSAASAPPMPRRGLLGRFFSWNVKIPARGSAYYMPGFLLILLSCCLCWGVSAIVSPRTPTPTATPRAGRTPVSTPTGAPAGKVLLSEPTALATFTSIPSPTEKLRDTPTIIPSVTPVLSRVITAGNLRDGPGTNFAIVGVVSPGQQYQVIGRTEAADWYQLANGKWVYGEILDSAEKKGIPVVTPALTPTPN